MQSLHRQDKEIQTFMEIYNTRSTSECQNALAFGLTH